MRLYLYISVFVITGLLLQPSEAFAQRQIVTDHFYIYFSSESEHTARRIADVAEEVFDDLAASFDFYDEFSRIHLLVHDDQDVSNGFANYYENRVEIWASDLDFPYLRGSHEWIKLVVTHELAHIVSLKVASKGIFNAIILQSGQFNRNPDFSIVLPWLHLVAPSWYVEGIAQLVDDQIGYDSWDTHRDMLLRMATLENKLLTYSEMGVFGHDSIGSELVYNQGYGLLRYIKERFGDGKAEALAKDVGYLRFDATVKNVLGIGANTLYKDWKQYLRRLYADKANKIASSRLGTVDAPVRNQEMDIKDEDLDEIMTPFDSRFEGNILVDGGSFDLHPTFSPDGTKLAYVSNGDNDFVITSIWIKDLETGRLTDTKQRANTSISWTPDGKSLVYGRRKGAYFDVYIYNTEVRKAGRLSANLRVRDPAVSPDGQSIAFVKNQDGTTNIGLMNINGTDVRYLTNNNDGTIYYTPRWSPDGSKLLLSIFRGEDRDVGILDVNSPTFIDHGGQKADDDSLAFADTTAFLPIIQSTADERDPTWLPDGSGIVFSSDRDGIFNVYELTLSSGEIRRRTDVLGGAFMSSVSPDGDRIAYAGYHAKNYSIFEINRTESINEPIEIPSVTRDYHSILSDPGIDETYTVGGVPRRWSMSGIIPILGFSQTFIGNEFGLNAIDFGGQMTLHDVLNRDQLFLSGSVGLNFRHKIEPNLNGTIVYERRLPSILSKNTTLAPSIYGVYDRSILNNIRDRTSGFQDTSVVGAVVQLASGQLDTVNATRISNEVFNARDKFKFDFNTFALGLRVPLTSRQSILVEHARRTYREGFDTSGPDRIRQQVFVGSQLLADIDTTITLSGRTLDDTKFFTSNSTLFFWSYQTLRPALDSAINPSGGRNLALWYRRVGSTVTDSLLSPTERIVDGQTIPIRTPPNQFATLVPVRNRLNLNELGISWTEYIRMPFRRHTLTLSSVIRYQDKQLREAVNGGGFYWPLRIFLGGQGTLSGYPYFTLSGSKVASWRAAYTMPVFPEIHKRFLFLYLDRLYLSGFWEGGGAWNFEKLTTNGLKSSRMLHSAGLQLRMQVFNFYRIPMIAYFQSSFPLTKITQRSRENLGLPAGRDIDDVRIYFGLGF